MLNEDKVKELKKEFAERLQELTDKPIEFVYNSILKLIKEYSEEEE